MQLRWRFEKVVSSVNLAFLIGIMIHLIICSLFLPIDILEILRFQQDDSIQQDHDVTSDRWMASVQEDVWMESHLILSLVGLFTSSLVRNGGTNISLLEMEKRHLWELFIQMFRCIHAEELQRPEGNKKRTCALVCQAEVI